MVRLEEYSNLNRKQKDLLTKGFNYESAFLASFTSTSKDLVFKAKASESHALAPVASLITAGSASLAYTYDNFLFKPKRRADGSSVFLFEYTPKEVLKDLKLTAQLTTSPTSIAQKAELSGKVVYNHPTAVARLRLDDSLYTLNASVSLGKPELGTGFKGKFNLQQQSLMRYAFAFWWVKKYRKIVAKQIHTGKNSAMTFDQLLFSYYEKLNPTTHLAASARFNLNSQDAFIEFGARHQLSDSTFLKAKVDSNGQISLAHSKALNSHLNFNTSAQLDARKLNTHSIHSYKLGFRLDFNH